MVFERIKRAFHMRYVPRVILPPIDTCKASVEKFKDCKTYLRGMLLEKPEREVLMEIGLGRISGSLRPAFIYNTEADKHEVAEALVEKGLATVTHTGKTAKVWGSDRVGQLDKFELTEKGICARDVAKVHPRPCICETEEGESPQEQTRRGYSD